MADTVFSAARHLADQAAPNAVSGGRRRRLRASLTGWGFVAPATAIILGLSIFPAIWAFVLSFQDWDGFSPAVWVGAQNYTDLIQDADFWNAVRNTALFTVLFVPTSVAIGLVLAVALNRHIRWMGFYRTAIFVPFVVSAASTGIISTYLFSPQFGLVNNVLRVLHLPQQGWLDDPQQAMFVIVLMSLWGSAAFTTVIYLAALQDVPPELLEAARMDGATLLSEFRHVILPLAMGGIASTGLLCLVLAWNEAFWSLNLTAANAGTLAALIASYSSPEGLFWSKLSAASVLAIAPIVVFGWFSQKQLVQGLTFGAVK